MIEEQTPPVATGDEASPSLTETPAPVTDVEPTVDLEAETESATPVVTRTTPKGANPHSELNKPVSELRKQVASTFVQVLSLLDVTVDEFNALADNYPNAKFASGEHGQRWLESIEEAQGHLHRANALVDSLNRANSLWRQSVTSGDEQLAAGRPRLAESEAGNRLTGERARQVMQGALGLGQIVRVPLWHSGIWVSIKAPTEGALLELMRKIGEEKVLLGRMSNGLLFSNTSVHTAIQLVDFVLNHVYDATFKFGDVQELKKLILVTDLQTLLWGMLCAIYPGGYPYQKPCVANPEKCQHIVEEQLALSKLSWTDDRALTDKQRRHMSRRGAKFTEQEIRDYQADHNYAKNSVVKLNSNLKMVLRVPTLDDYQNSGFTWIDSIVRQADRVFAGKLAGEARNQYLYEQSQVQAMRQYAHWVDKLAVIQGDDDSADDVIPTDALIIDTREDVEENVAELTSHDSVFQAYFDGVGKYIDETTISLIAIPKYNCPNCGEEMTSEERKHPYLIALDVASLFFTLIDQRISRALSRLR